MKSVREFESEASDVGRWKLKRQKCSPSPSLPHEIIENILSRLPVKDLVRFRVVCKLWEATISDPTFAGNHLQQHYKNPSVRNLIAWEKVSGYNGLHVAELRNNCIEFVSAIEFGLGCDSVTLCSCDGLYLKYFASEQVNPVRLVLWNPSCRRYRELYSPPSIEARCFNKTIHGMYYDSLMKDYKIVIADMEHYAVYSCRDNKWGDVKEMKGFMGDYYHHVSIFVNGSLYWLVMDSFDAEDKYLELICFDCKDESFKRLALPNCENRYRKYLRMTSLGGQLYLLITELLCHRVEIMKKVGSSDEWMESKEECLCGYRPEFLILNASVVSENEILLYVANMVEGGGGLHEMVYMVCDKSKNALVEIHNNHPPCTKNPPITHHRENLLWL